MKFKMVLLSCCCSIMLYTTYAYASGIVYLDTKEGMNMLTEANGNADFASMIRFREPQRFQTYCGVASSIDVLNSLGIESSITNPDTHPYNQYTMYSFYTKEVLDIKIPMKVQQEGIELDNLGKMLNTFARVSATVYHAGTDNLTDLTHTRKLIADALSDKDSRVIVNFYRGALGQPGSGHFSPLAAYDEKTDRVLILDTASYKLPPAWVSMDDMWKAMATVDSDGAGPHMPSNRGFIIIHKMAEETFVQRLQNNTWSFFSSIRKYVFG